MTQADPIVMEIDGNAVGREKVLETLGETK